MHTIVQNYKHLRNATNIFATLYAHNNKKETKAHTGNASLTERNNGLFTD